LLQRRCTLRDRWTGTARCLTLRRRTS